MKIDLSQYTILHLQNIKKYLGQTRSLYIRNINRVVNIYERWPAGVPFDLAADYDNKVYQFTGYVKDLPERFVEFQKDTGFVHYLHD